MSIPITEIREGSLVFDEALGECRVTGFHKDQVWVVPNSGDEGSVKADFLKPIPLTDKWIVRFGGAEVSPGEFKLKGITIKKRGTDFWVDISGSQKIPFPSVHTLQYFLALKREDQTDNSI